MEKISIDWLAVSAAGIPAGLPLDFAGVGLRTDLRQMRKQGLRPLVAGAVGEFAIAGLTPGMLLAVAPLLHL